MKLVRGLWNGLRTCVCASIRPCVNEKCYFSSISWPFLIVCFIWYRAGWGLQNFYKRILKFINYANLCIFIQNQRKMSHFSISQRILIMFVLSDRAWWGLRNFYTELWNSLIMQIYANLFKINEKCHLSIQKSQQICTWGGDVYYASHNLLSTCLQYLSCTRKYISSRYNSKVQTAKWHNSAISSTCTRLCILHIS